MSKGPYPYIIQGGNIVLMIDNDSHTISSETHVNYNRILEAIRGGDWKTVSDLVDVQESITNYVNGKLVIKNGEIFWNGRPYHNALSKRLMAMYEQGFDIGPLTKFMENLEDNPSYRACEELYGFLEKNELPLTPTGNFLAYKRVHTSQQDKPELNIKAGDLVDCYTKTMINNVGSEVSMIRNEVDDNADNVCSAGLHFASLDYLSGSGYGGRSEPIVIVEINPADVVSIPTDYNNQKGRACKYTVVGLHGVDASVEAFDSVVEEVTVEVPSFDAEEQTTPISLEKEVDNQVEKSNNMFRRPGN